MTVTVLEELKEGASAPLPKLGDKVVVHYSGWLALRPDGEPFDSSREKGHAFTFTVGVGKVIDGWDEAVRAMGKGARRRVMISSDQAYGPRGRPPVIPCNSDLIFDIEVLNINETLLEEGMRVRREEEERVSRFLLLQDEARAAEAKGASKSQPASKRARRDDESSSGSSSDSLSESSGERRRRKRERKERKREKRERKEKREKEKKRKHKEGKAKKEKDKDKDKDKEHGHKDKDKDKHKKRARSESDD